jgi:alkylation response protein AidB-like acyl-CoA dehydrogenase
MADHFDLHARSAPGERLVARAESLHSELAACAAIHDRSGRYPVEHLDRLRKCGLFLAPVPVECGGLGVESIHDLALASARIARAEPSITLGLNMHYTTVNNLVRRWRGACSRGKLVQAEALRQALERVATDGSIIAAAVSEPGQDLTMPATRAERSSSGWRLSGRKIFCSMAPAATELATSVVYEGRDGKSRYAFAQIPVSTPGVLIHDDWDGLGMRASGSCSVSFDDVSIPETLLSGGFPAGSLSVGYVDAFLSSGLFHGAVPLGIAEAAMDLAASRRSARGATPRAYVLAAENAVDVATMRAIFSRASDLVDGYFVRAIRTDSSLDESVAIFNEVQIAKTAIQEAAVRVVDRSMTLAGGAGFLGQSTLARAYRDVRACAFMHPLSSQRAYDFIGAVALGDAPDLH